MKYFVIAIVSLVLLVVAGLLLRDRLFGRETTAVAVDAWSGGSGSEPTAGVAKSQRAAMLAVVGVVERRAGDTWVQLASGDVLSSQDEIRTGDGASAKLDLGAAIVDLEDRSQLTVGDLSASVAQVLVGEGRVLANAGAPGGATIRIAARGTDVVAESDEGQFAMLSGGRGQVAVAAQTGRVQVSAAGRRVEVGAGQQTIVQPGGAPSAPDAIPASLFLKVDAKGRGRLAELDGLTTPGAVVSINGVRSVVDASGKFVGNVELEQGPNVIVVKVEDASGRRETRVIKRAVPKGPAVSTEVTW